MLIPPLKFHQINRMVRDKFRTKDISVSCRIQTNLTLLNDNWIKVFKEDCPQSVGVSLDYKTYARVNSKGENYDKTVLENVCSLKKKLINVGVSTLVTPKNVKLVQEMYDFYKSNKLDFKVARYFPSSNPLPQEAEFILSDEEYAIFLCSLYDIWVNDKKPEIKILNFLEMASGLIDGKRCLCTSAPEKCYKSYICVEAGGEIYNCGRYDTKQYRLGTINDSPEIISNKVEQRGEILLPQKCSSCSCLPLCHGGCPFELETCGKYLDCNITREILIHIAQHLKASGIILKIDPAYDC